MQILIDNKNSIFNKFYECQKQQQSRGATAIISYGITVLNSIRSNKNTTKEEKKELIEQLNSSIAQQFYQFSQTIKPEQKKGKKYSCFIGQTSVGKTTLCNDLFNLDLPTGISRTTIKIQKIHQKDHTIYFDVPGKDNDWQTYSDQDVAFFKSVDRCFLLYSGQVKEVKFIAELLNKMETQLIFVRNQCDKHKTNMKPIDQVLQEDRADLKKMCIKYTTVIPSGLNNRVQIRKWI